MCCSTLRKQILRECTVEERAECTLKTLNFLAACPPPRCALSFSWFCFTLCIGGLGLPGVELTFFTAASMVLWFVAPTSIFWLWLDFLYFPLCTTFPSKHGKEVSRGTQQGQLIWIGQGDILYHTASSTAVKAVVEEDRGRGMSSKFVVAQRIPQHWSAWGR